MTDVDAEKIVKAAASVLAPAGLELIYADSGDWSMRLCGTCRVISAMTGKPFGCYRYQAEHKKKNAGE